MNIIKIVDIMILKQLIMLIYIKIKEKYLLKKIFQIIKRSIIQIEHILLDI